MVNGYLSAGDIAPQILFYNGPGATGYTTARDAMYNWSATPTFQIDGVNQQLGWSQANVQNYINARLTVPSYVNIDLNVVGDASGGTVYYTVQVEQDPGVTGELRIWSAIVESHEIAGTAYGVYNGQELMWEPRAMPMGNSGTEISITGPYPQTINMSGTYTLNPVEHTFDNLEIITYVQAFTGTHQVLNSSFIDLPDTASGVYEEGSAQVESNSFLSAWPNPSTGTFSVATQLPRGVGGTIEIFDVTGRSVDSFGAGSIQSRTIEEPGLYFIRLTTTSGEVVNRQVAIVR